MSDADIIALVRSLDGDDGITDEEILLASHQHPIVFDTLALVRDIEAVQRDDLAEHPDLDDFRRVTDQLLSQKDCNEENEKNFNLFSGNMSKIGLNDLKRIAQDLGEAMAPTLLQALVNSVDENGDGMVGPEEYDLMCKHKIGQHQAPV